MARTARVGVAAVCLLAPVVIFPGALNVVDVVKWTVVVGAAGILLGLGVAIGVGTGAARVPRGPLAWSLVIFLAALAVATLASDARLQSLFGMHTRYTGLLLYAAVVVVFLAVLLAYTERTLAGLAYVLVGASVPVAAYGLLQALDPARDPIAWVRVYGDSVVATLGNPNFAGAYFAIMLPLVAWVALRPRHPLVLRVAAGGFALVSTYVLYRTDADQGVLAGAAGLSILALSFAIARGGRWRDLAPAAWGAGAVLGAGLVAAGAAQVGPLAFLGGQIGTRLRTYYWQAAWSMFTDAPLLGVGPDRYARFYREHRPVEAVLEATLPATNEAAHSVPLQLLATGGLVVGLAYLVFVLLTGWALLQGLRNLDGDRRLLLAGFGGAWMAYQVQSFVSIDVPPLAVLHWVLAGAVWVASGQVSWGQHPLPWRREPKSAGKRRKGAATVPPKVRQVGWACGALVSLVVLWGATLPIRADLAAGSARQLSANQAHAEARAELDRAVSLAGWEWVYWEQRGRAAYAGGDPLGALYSFQQGVMVSRGDFAPALLAARVAVGHGQHQTAQEAFETALAAEPLHPDLKVEYAQYLIDRGEAGRAQELLQAALEVDPDHPGAARLLGASEDG